MDYFSILLGALCSTKFERSAQNACGSPHGVLVGNFAQEGNFPSPCNGLFALEGLTFATVFLDASSARRLIEPDFKTCVCSGDRYGLISPVEQLPLRSLLPGGYCFCPTAKLHRDHCLLATFKDNKVR